MNFREIWDPCHGKKVQVMEKELEFESHGYGTDYSYLACASDVNESTNPDPPFLLNWQKNKLLTDLGHVSMFRKNLNHFQLGLFSPGRQSAGQFAAQKAAADDNDWIHLSSNFCQTEIIKE